MSATKGRLVGGVVCECIGGPLDGDLLYFDYGTHKVCIGHFYDPQRTPWIGGARPGDDNYLGAYWANHESATADWRGAQPNPETAA